MKGYKKAGNIVVRCECERNGRMRKHSVKSMSVIEKVKRIKIESNIEADED